MSRMVKCSITGIKGDSSEFYKVGTKWFKDKETYLNHLRTKDVTYNDVLKLLTEDKNIVISSNTKNKIVQIILEDIRQKEK